MKNMSRRWALFLVVILGSAIVAGCFTKKYPVKRRYVFEIHRTGEPSTAAAGVLRVGRIRVSSLFERKSFVYQTSEGKLEDDFYNEFFISPGSMLTEEVRQWVATSGLFPHVADLSGSGEPTYFLGGRITALYGDYSKASAPITRRLLSSING